MKTGKLFLIPVTLGDEALPQDVMSEHTLEAIRDIRTFIVENEKSARHFLKKAGTRVPMQELILYPIGKHVQEHETSHYLDAASKGEHIGLLSEAGCPGVADPGSFIVKRAHEKNIQVVPLTGPSSLLLALMASGMNGQQFTFHGYLPMDKNERVRKIKFIEQDTLKFHTSHIFIETPFRNRQLLDELLAVLKGNVRLCIAVHLTLPDEWIKTKTIDQWKKGGIPDFHKKPAVFIIGN
ncbi:MAG: SAM-dependent methyltransferase [Bacteroidia bacterium]